MNSTLDIILNNVDEEKSVKVYGKILLKSIQLEKMLSCFDPEAEIYQINKAAYKKWVRISDELWSILVECLQYNELTNGYFDIGLGKYKQKGDFLHETESNKVHGINSIEFDYKKKAIRFTSSLTAIDLGGIGKGLLLREVGLILDHFNVTNCLVSFGGSSILVKGTHPFGDSWPLSVRDSVNGHRVLHLKDDCASFSGAEPESKTPDKNHIIDPQRLIPVENKRFVIVQCKSPVLAEVLSTSLVIADHEFISDIVSGLRPDKVFVYRKSASNKIKQEYVLE